MSQNIFGPAAAGAKFEGAVAASGSFSANVRAATRYRFECHNKAGRFKWVEEFDNLVVTSGLNDLIDKYFKGSTYTAAHYVGLKGAGSVAAGDTMSSHAGWAEITPYSDATRPAFTPGTVSGGSVDNSASKAVFNINATATIAGAFLATDNTKGGTTGTLYGAGDFSASRSVESGDTLSVTITPSVTAS